MSYWRDDAACLSYPPEAWHPGTGHGRAAKVAVVAGICARCPVRQRCAEFALNTPRKTGVWAGVDFGESNNRPADAQLATLRLIVDGDQ